VSTRRYHISQQSGQAESFNPAFECRILTLNPQERSNEFSQFKSSASINRWETDYQIS